jgi:hypothetical protein
MCAVLIADLWKMCAPIAAAAETAIAMMTTNRKYWTGIFLER